MFGVPMRNPVDIRLATALEEALVENFVDQRRTDRQAQRLKLSEKFKNRIGIVTTESAGRQPIIKKAIWWS